jgi:hypothetical protein
MRLARAVWLTVAVLVLIALIGLVIASREPGGPQASLATLQIGVVTHLAQSAAEATAATQAMQTATVGALETQVAQLHEPNSPIASSPVLGTPALGGTTSRDHPGPIHRDNGVRDICPEWRSSMGASSRWGERVECGECTSPPVVWIAPA